jgi:hypothetical protein
VHPVKQLGASLDLPASICCLRLQRRGRGGC